MKAIIDGKKYDTEKSEWIGNASYGYPGDFSYYDEDLYRTKNGGWFVAGEGGAMSSYAQSVDQNTTSSGSGISVLTSEEALAWCERNDIDADLVCELFDIQEA